MKKIEIKPTFLKKLFFEMEKQNIKYCVVRGFSDRGEKIIGRDVDILIEEKDTKKIRKILKELLLSFAFDVYFNKKAGSDQYFLLLKEESEYKFLILDFLRGLQWRGIPIIPLRKIFRNLEKPEFFFVPKPQEKAFIDWIFPFITGGEFKKKYHAEVISASQGKRFIMYLEELFGKKTAEEILSFIQKGNFQKAKTLRFKARRKLLLKAATRPQLVKNIILNLLLTFKEKLKPKGIWIAILGPDGSGKSTISLTLTKKLERSIFPQVRTFHWRPSILPSLSKIFTGKDSGAIPDNIKKPHGIKPAGIISSFLRLLYYSSDFFLGYFLKVRRKLYEGNLVIFDRYFHDFMVDPQRAKISIPWTIPFIISKIIPHPDIIFCLLTDPEIIYNRKKELSENEIEKMIKKYEKMCKKFEYCVKIDAKENPERITQTIESMILKKWKKRLKKL